MAVELVAATVGEAQPNKQNEIIFKHTSPNTYYSVGKITVRFSCVWFWLLSGFVENGLYTGTMQQSDGMGGQKEEMGQKRHRRASIDSSRMCVCVCVHVGEYERAYGCVAFYLQINTCSYPRLHYKYCAHIRTMPDKPFSVLLHMATSFESSLFIATSNTVYWGGYSRIPHSNCRRLKLCPSLYIYLKTQSAIHIHSNMLLYTIRYTYNIDCITSYKFNSDFSHQSVSRERDSGKIFAQCVLFRSHFLLKFSRAFVLFFAAFRYPHCFLITWVEIKVREISSHYLVQFNCIDTSAIVVVLVWLLVRFTILKYISNCMDKWRKADTSIPFSIFIISWRHFVYPNRGNCLRYFLLNLNKVQVLIGERIFLMPFSIQCTHHSALAKRICSWYMLFIASTHGWLYLIFPLKIVWKCWKLKVCVLFSWMWQQTQWQWFFAANTTCTYTHEWE